MTAQVRREGIPLTIRMLVRSKIRVYQALEHLRRSYPDHAISLSMIAAKVGMSPWYLSRLTRHKLEYISRDIYEISDWTLRRAS